MSKTDSAGENAPQTETGTSGRVATAYSAVREHAESTAQTTVSGIEANPMAALLGGLAIGAIAGVLLPRSEKERELLRPVGARINDAARAAMEAGRSAGTGALADAGLTGDNLRSQSSKLFEQAIKAASAAGTAAATAARDSTRR